MKKILSLLVCFLLVIGLTVPAAAEENVVSIVTRQDLEAVRDHPGGSYRLDRDINLGEAPWIPIPFSGKLDGNGHTIYNLQVTQSGDETAVTVDGNNKTYDTKFAGLFSTLQSAEIEDLTILGAEVTVETADNCFAAILSGYMEDSTVTDCRVQGSVSLYTTGVMVGVGGIAGFGAGTIQDCEAQVQLTFADRRDSHLKPRCEQFLGGILACGNADLLSNTVEIQGYDSCWGYVHNGGLIGMHYQWDKAIPNGKINDNFVSGSIQFFENNPDRRAYCSPFGGELLTFPSQMLRNKQEFRSKEYYNRKEELKPHDCENPSMEENSISHTDTEWGFTDHVCQTCGYRYRSDYQAPGHVPDEVQVLQAPDYGQEGKSRISCAVCGQVLEETVLPALIPVSECRLSEEETTLHYKDSQLLTVRVFPEDAEDTGVLWESSDPSVVSVDPSGRITALGRGQATVTCRSSDGFAEGSCQVTADYSPRQWLIEILLFGWLWY